MYRALLLTLVLTLASTSALALEEPIAFGARAGYTSWDGLQQMHLGGHAILAEILPNVDYRASGEFGIGDDMALIGFNNDIVYRFTELTTAPWGLYGGSGLSLQILDAEFMDADTQLGLSAVVGGTYDLAGGNRLLAEVRLGLMDAADLKLTIGYTFTR